MLMESMILLLLWARLGLLECLNVNILFVCEWLISIQFGMRLQFIALLKNVFSSHLEICLSHAALISHLDTFTVVNSNDIFFYTSALYWATGLIAFLTGSLNGATRIITTKSLSPQLILHIIESYNVTVVFCSPFYLIDMLKSNLLPKTDLSRIRHLLIGGWSTPLSIIKEFESYLSDDGSVNNGYGMTELGAYIAIDFPKCSDTESVGRILHGITVKIIDKNGNRCGIDVMGEICIKDRFKCLGYLGNSEAFNQSIDSEGFLMTGDIGHIDKYGRLYIVDRKKDVIFCLKEDIFPSVVENVLLKSSDIEGACVVGVPYGPILEVPAAVVVRSTNSNIREDDIQKMVEGEIQ